jgi:hypothetical protein
LVKVKIIDNPANFAGLPHQHRSVYDKDKDGRANKKSAGRYGRYLCGFDRLRAD